MWSNSQIGFLLSNTECAWVSCKPFEYCLHNFILALTFSFTHALPTQFWNCVVYEIPIRASVCHFHSEHVQQNNNKKRQEAKGYDTIDISLVGDVYLYTKWNTFFILLSFNSVTEPPTPFGVKIVSKNILCVCTRTHTRTHAQRTNITEEYRISSMTSKG